MDPKRAPHDLRVARIAARQHGVVSIRQLRSAGLTDTAVRNRVRTGRLHRAHRGVYAVGHRALSLEGRWMAAVLAFPDEAVLSHRSAAELWGLLPRAGGPTDLTISSRGGRGRRAGIRLHRSSTLTPEQRTRNRGFPVTTPSRTISDLRRVISEPELRRAIRQAELLGLPTGLPVHLPTRSELEDRFLALCRRHRLPPPEVNVSLGGLTVDFLWRKSRLVVETDGYRYHRGSVAFEDDHDRDLRLRRLGFDVVRLSFRQVTRESAEVAALLRRELAPGGPPPT
jgi:very-short-patch-repair endonuclease